jgi:hypothetical protein
MKLYILQHEINSPRFSRPFKAGEKFPENQLKYFGFEPTMPRFAHFFQESETEEIKHCRIVQKTPTNDQPTP